MGLRERAVDAKLRSIEKALRDADLRLMWADGRREAGDACAAPVISAVHAKVKALVAQAASLRPISLTGIASKARIVGRHHEIDGVGRAALRSLVEDLHALEPLRRR